MREDFGNVFLAGYYFGGEHVYRDGCGGCFYSLMSVLCFFCGRCQLQKESSRVNEICYLWYGACHACDCDCEDCPICGEMMKLRSVENYDFIKIVV